MFRKLLHAIPFIVTLLLTQSAIAQEVDSTDIDTEPFSDSVFITPPVLKKHFGRAAGELLLVELIPLTYNNYIAKTDFACVSFKSIADNLNPGNWEFDVDKFLTNQFAHPYHGNLYYNSFRSNGYSFWQSAPAALSGSLLWEIAGENTYASVNDLCNTTLGGIALGEMTHRMAGLIINEKKHGAGRQFQEAFATLVNPVNGFNRIIDGQWGQVAFTDPEDSLFVDFAMDAGYRRVSKTASTLFSNGGRNEWFGSIAMRYGNPFKDYKKPYDNFYVYVEVGGSDSALLNSIWVQGNLFTKYLGGGRHSDHLLRVTQNYDFYKNTAFEYGGQSLLATWAAHYYPNPKWQIFTEVGAGPIILAAAPDKHKDYNDARNYAYGSGAQILASGQIAFNDMIFYKVMYRAGWTATLNGSSSGYGLKAFNTELRCRIYKNLTLSSTFGDFRLKSYYPDFDDTNEKFPFFKLAVGYKIIF